MWEFLPYNVWSSLVSLLNGGDFLRSGVVLEVFVSIEPEESIGTSLSDIEISTIKMPFQSMT
jgi:hypothetical protein